MKSFYTVDIEKRREQLAVVGCLFEILIPIIVYVIAKSVLNLVIPWWGIVLAPLWFFIASLLPGGFLITNLILAVFGIMHTSWWTWVISGLASLLFLNRMPYKLWLSLCAPSDHLWD